METIKIGEKEIIQDPFKVKLNMIIWPAFRSQILDKYPEKFYYAKNLNTKVYYNNIIEVTGDLNIMDTEVHEIIAGEETFKVILRVE